MTSTCYGCGVEVPRFDHYCAECVAGQLAEQRREREAFDAFHVFADAIARGEIGGPGARRSVKR